MGVSLDRKLHLNLLKSIKYMSLVLTLLTEKRGALTSFAVQSFIAIFGFSIKETQLNEYKHACHQLRNS